MPNERNKAYVTFASDRSAYLALAHNEIERRNTTVKFNIQPADTWIQPIASDTTGDDPMEGNQVDDDAVAPKFFILNEDCMLELIKYLDLDSLVNLSNVCKLFHRLLHQHVFPHYRKFSIVNNNSMIPMPLAKVRQTLMSIGPYITDLEFVWHDFDHDDRLQRFLEKLEQYIGKNVRCVRFRHALLNETHFSTIKGILQRLDILEMVVYNPDYELDLDFATLCPDLRRLKLLENMVLVKCCKPWPSLTYLSIVGNEFMELSEFQSFLKQNPQLRCLKFTAYHAPDRIQAVAQYSTNVEKLTILPSFPNLAASNIVYLNSLQHLTKLSLMYLEDDDLNGILECLTRFHGLRVLKLHLFFDNNDEDGHYEPKQQALISLAQELPHLEKFYTRYIKWKESTVIDFIQNANQLNAMHIHWCDLTTTNSLVWKIVKVLQANRPQPQTSPLNLFVNPKDVDGLQMINDQDLIRYLHVHTKCHHTEDEQSAI